MLSRHTMQRLWRGGAVLSLALVAACATTTGMRQTHAPEPAPCTDSMYVQLKRQHPDSLSERAWQRLQALDRDCVTARDQPHETMGGMMGMGHGTGAWMGVAVAAAMMIAAMVALR